MALTIKDILQLQSLRGFRLVSGHKGLSRYVTSVGILDYEVCPDIDYPRDTAFEKDSVVLSSLLFAKDNPELILPAVEQLYASGVSGFAYKTVIYSNLPEEVNDFSEEHNFPIFCFGKDTYFENIIFEVMNAVQSDDTNLLTESTIKKMIENDLSKSQVYFLSKNVSLKFKEYAMGVYIKDSSDDFCADIDRHLKNFYLNRNLNDKALICKYEDGIFAVLTARQPKHDSFSLILDDLLTFLNPSGNTEATYGSKPGFKVSCSNIHMPHENLDLCFRESYFTYLASSAESRDFHCYSSIGTYQFLIPQRDTDVMQAYIENNIGPLKERPDYFETVHRLVLCGGDTSLTADFFGCHQNTIRYRLGKIKALLHLESETEQDFYAVLAAAMRLYLIKESE
ncbi:MAG: PucR family transcriptional regulator [Firmicutes bacterium]|nr:PucR family transcriptional regulator [Bacillota bacterium]